MGKRKYVAIRKETANAKHKGRRLPNFVTYDTLMKYIKSVDIGTLYDVKEVLSKNVPEEEQGEGKFGKMSENLPRLDEFYLRVNHDRLDKPKEYSVFSKTDASAFQFLVIFGGDGAPCKEGTATAFLCSFSNVGERLASSPENFLVFGANVKKNGEVVKNYLQMVSEELSEIESKTFSVSVNGEIKLVEFGIAELPNDMKMLAFFGR